MDRLVMIKILKMEMDVAASAKSKAIFNVLGSQVYVLLKSILQLNLPLLKLARRLAIK